MKKRLLDLILILIMLAGFGLILYPFVSDWWNQMHESHAVAGYIGYVADMSGAEKQNEWDKAEAFNRELASRGTHFPLTEAEQAEYDSLLDVSGTGIMGYIQIPKIDVELPIYHGTSEAVLEIGIGHFEGTSLPVGGESTHCVLSGHRGLPSSRLFSDLVDLEEGDTFTLTVLDRVLTYRVDQIRTVLPGDLADIQIENGRDYCTLVTCTPYGVNTHRILVRGVRVANEEADVLVSPDAAQIDPIKVTPVLAVLLVMILLLWYLIGRISRKQQ